MKRIDIKPKHIRFIIQLLSLALIIFNKDVESYVIGGTFLIVSELGNIQDAIENINK